MGYSIKSGQYRFTRWQLYEKSDSVMATELYDVSESRVATRNLALDSEYESEVQRFNQIMDEELARHKTEKNQMSDLLGIK
jgi:iduronate 2-sulfatase